MKTLICICFLFPNFNIVGQSTISGIIIDKKTKLPVENVSVYINQSTIASKTDKEGYYILKQPYTSSFELVITHVNYKKYYKTFKNSLEKITENVEVDFQNKALEEVVVMQYEKDGWKKWGQFFLIQLFGESEASRNCVLKNHEKINFRFDKRTRILEAFTMEPLLIENKYLKYDIKYDLEKFNYDYKKGLFILLGFSRYTDNSKDLNERKLTKVLDKRQIAYYGSSIHFFKSLYKNKMKENGFSVYRIKTVEIESVTKTKVSEELKGHPKNLTITIPKQTKDIIQTNLLTLDSLILGQDTTDKNDIMYAISFTEKIFVQFDFENEDYNYAIRYFREPQLQKTKISFATDKNIFWINKFGRFFPPEDIILEGYMGYERLGEMLPIDYN